MAVEAVRPVVHHQPWYADGERHRTESTELDKDKLHETMAHPIELGEALEPGAA